MKICPICHGKYENYTKCPKCNVVLLDQDAPKGKKATKETHSVDEKKELYQVFNKKINKLKETGLGGQKFFSEENQDKKKTISESPDSRSENKPDQDDTVMNLSEDGRDQNDTAMKHAGKSQENGDTYTYSPEKNDSGNITISKKENGESNVSVSMPAVIFAGIVVLLLLLCLVASSGNKKDDLPDAGQPAAESEDPMDNEETGDRFYSGSIGTEDSYYGDDGVENEEEGMSLPYTENEYPDINACLSEADFASVYSEDNSFQFCYPKYLFNNFSYNEDRQEYYFSYEEDGNEFCSLKVYKVYNPNSDAVEAAKNLRYQFQNYYEKANYYWPTEDLSKLTTDQNSDYKEPRGDGVSRYVMSGWKTYDQSQLLYCLGANDGSYDYILEFSYPEYDTNDDMETWDYVTECIYRSCSFSGTSYAVRSYETFIQEGYGEGHH